MRTLNSSAKLKNDKTIKKNFSSPKTDMEKVMKKIPDGMRQKLSQLKKLKNK